MSTLEKGQIVTANRLRDGIAVFLNRSGQWSEKIDEATLALEPEAAGALDPGWMHTGCVHVGSADYYKWLNGRPDMATLDCSRTHAAGGVPAAIFRRAGARPLPSRR